MERSDGFHGTENLVRSVRTGFSAGRGQPYLTSARLKAGQYVISSKTPSMSPIRASDAIANFMSGLFRRMAAMKRFIPTGGVL